MYVAVGDIRVTRDLTFQKEKSYLTVMHSNKKCLIQSTHIEMPTVVCPGKRIHRVAQKIKPLRNYQ